MRIGFLACPETMPASGVERRGDAFEHDLQVTALRPAIEAKGGTLTEIEWRAPIAAFDGIDLVLLGTSWDYQDHPEAFLAKLELLESQGIVVCNPPALVRWNMDKGYLKQLNANGVRTVPTLWSDNPRQAEILTAMENFGCDKLVVKRQIGAGALGQFLFTRNDLPDSDWQMGHKAMLQPFLPAIKQEGELSLIFVEGHFSHALRKTPAAGDYRIQSLYGGIEEAVTPDDADIETAAQVVRAMPGDTPLYARIDLIRDGNGGLMVMEAEVIEPFLYPVQGPELGERIARAIWARLHAH